MYQKKEEKSWNVQKLYKYIPQIKKNTPQSAYLLPLRKH